MSIKNPVEFCKTLEEKNKAMLERLGLESTDETATVEKQAYFMQALQEGMLAYDHNLPKDNPFPKEEGMSEHLGYENGWDLAKSFTALQVVRECIKEVDEDDGTEENKLVVAGNN